MTKTLILSFVCITMSLSTVAQYRIAPAKNYTAGETFYSPVYGLEMTMPEHCSGFLTRDTEVFSVNIDSLTDWNIMMFPVKGSLSDIKENWAKGDQLAPGINANAGPVEELGQNMIRTDFSFSNDKNRIASVLSKCGDFGSCFSIAIIHPNKVTINPDLVLEALARSISFSDPSLKQVNEDFDWKAALMNKYVFLYESGGGSAKKNELWFCADGTFKARIVRDGLLKNTTGKYKGKLKGSYVIEGMGNKGTLKLSFKKLAPIVVNLELKEDIIYLNDQRHSVVAYSCK